MDPLSAPGGFLGGFVLLGIMLPVAVSFVGDGIVYLFRGRGPSMLFFSATLTIAILGIASLATQNANFAGEASDIAGAVGLIMWFAVPVAAAGFGLRMLALKLNPASRDADLAAISARIAHEDARREERARRAKHAKAVA